ncbi:Hypothetical predicted protein [Paramuricea clavata]|uniref:Uncharacterized protein n=1 Tax=Paramuricea clavata TaxID=317549 RepID=A0A6S7HMM9_PARCT|nr:Hypothetical predicted protein [Paramuricea clavata]
MTPSSHYDCRMKLRTGSRFVTDKDSGCLEEDAILSDYLSHCKLDQKNDNVTLCLPAKKDHEIPEGFGCIFYRQAKERIFSATDDEEECFTVIVFDEKGWDSDGVDKREQEQFGIRVVMNSWSEALLSPERDWTVTVDKLQKYMDFLFSLKNSLFDGS